MRDPYEHYPARCGRIFFIFFGLTTFSFSLLARQEQGVVIGPASQTRFESNPGTILAIGLRVTNTTTVRQQYDATLSLPRGWRALTKDPLFELGPNESDTRLLTVSIPGEASPGHYEIRYAVSDRSSLPHRAEVVLGAVVLSRRQLELKAIDSPKFVVAGNSYHVTFELTNKSNASSVVRLRVIDNQNFPVRPDSSRVHMAPGETRAITVSVSTDPKTETSLQNLVELTARVDQDTTVLVKASSVVEIIPRTARTEEQYLELPMFFRARVTGDEQQYAPQAELSGSGSLSEDRHDRLEFLLRGPETQTRFVLGQRDEYHVHYATRTFEAYLGDWNFSLSPLTELSRYAAGGGGKITLGSLTLGGYYNETRFFSPKQKQTAGFMSYQVTQDAALGINYLIKDEQSMGEMVTLRSLVRPLKGTDVDLEYGAGSKDGARDNAYAARVSGNQQWVAYDLRYVQAGSNYPGYYRDLDYTSFSINLFPSHNFRIETNIQDQRRNLGQDTTLFIAPRDRLYQIGVGYSNLVSLYYRRSGTEDLLFNSKFSRQDESFQARLGYDFGGANAFANIDYGTTQDRLLNKNYPFQRFAVFSSFRLFNWQNYSASFEYSKDQNLFSDEVEERMSAGVTISFFLGEHTILSANGYASRINASTRQDYDLLDVTIEHTFPFDHKITLRGRQVSLTPSTAVREIAYVAEYAIPLALPIMRISAIGVLRGRVVDQLGRGLKNALLNAGGNASVTNKDGEFVFPSMKPGTYYLLLDKASIGLDRVTIQDMPMMTVVRGGEETHVEISVTRGCRVTGALLLFDFANESDSGSIRQVDVEGGAGAFFELSNGRETLRRVSDNHGRFSFTDLRPGDWRLTVSGREIPENHYLEHDSFEFSLKAGDERSVVVRVLPRKRTIRIIQQGIILQAETTVVQPHIVPIPTEEPCLIFPDKQNRGFILQVSSWKTSTKASREASRIQGIAGRKISVQRAKVPAIGTRYRVQVRFYKTRGEAEAACHHIHQHD